MKYHIFRLLGIALLLSLPAAAHAQENYDADGRPLLPEVQTFGTEHFVIHYTTADTIDAVDPTDADGSGVPDYVEQIGSTLEEVYDIQVNQFGWSVPPEDGSLGGDGRIDVYLAELMTSESIAGYVDDSGGRIGDNPNSPEVERSASFTYMALDNDYIEIEGDPAYSPFQYMQVTAAHEFNHVLQSGYDSNDPHSWLYEATAVWIEDAVYTDVNDGVFYIDEVFYSPDTCLVAQFGKQGYGLRWYGSWLFLRHLTERYGDELVQDIWANSRQLTGFQAIETVLQPFDTDLRTETFNYAVANLLRDYTEGANYLPVLVEGTARIGETFNPGDGVQSLGVDYIRLPAGPDESTVRALLLPLAGADLDLRAVGVRASGEADLIEGREGSLAIDLSRYDEAYLLVHNNEAVELEEDCLYDDYQITVDAVDISATPPSRLASAVNFTSPVDAATPSSDAPITGQPFGGGEFADSPEGLQVGFIPIIPQAVPTGYGFDYAYIAYPDEFGDTVDYYLPDAEEGASFDYLNQDNDWIGIVQSPTDYESVEEWLDDVGYDTDGSIETIDGVDVLFEDLSEGDDPYFSITLILNDLFIVIDGDAEAEPVREMTEAIIAAAEGTPNTPDITVATPNFAAPPPVLPPGAGGFSPGGGGASSTPAVAGISAVILGICGLAACLSAGVLALVAMLTSGAVRRRYQSDDHVTLS